MNDEDMDELIFLWNEYVKEKDERLTKDAIQLKQDIRKFVRRLPKFSMEFREGDFSKRKE